MHKDVLSADTKTMKKMHIYSSDVGSRFTQFLEKERFFFFFLNF